MQILPQSLSYHMQNHVMLDRATMTLDCICRIKTYHCADWTARHLLFQVSLDFNQSIGGGWGCEVFCGGHHRLRGKTTTGSALDGAVFDMAQILAYLVHNMSRSQLYLGFGHFGWLPSFCGQWHFGGLMVKLYFLCWNYSLSSGRHIIAA